MGLLGLPGYLPSSSYQRCGLPNFARIVLKTTSPKRMRRSTPPFSGIPDLLEAKPALVSSRRSRRIFPSNVLGAAATRTKRQGL